MDDQILIGVQRRLRALESNSVHYRIAENGTPQLTWQGGRTELSSATSSARDSIFNIVVYGANGDGSTDDTAAIQAAIDAAEVDGGIVFAPAGIYNFAGVLTFPLGVSLQGAGAPWADTLGTTFKGTDSTAQLLFENTTSFNSGFTIDGDNIADNPWRVDLSFGVTFTAINVQRAAEDNLVVYDAQQATFYSCNSTGATRDDLVIDGSTQSCLFSRWESDTPGRHGIYFGTDAGVFGNGNGFNMFQQCLCEQQSGVSDDPMMKIERCGIAGMTVFDSCLFVTGGGSASSIVEINEVSASQVLSVEFRSCRWQEGGSATRVGLLVDISNGQMPVVLSGQSSFLGDLTGGVKAVTDDTVRLHGDLQANLTPDGPVIDAASAEVRICSANFEAPSTDRFNAGTGWGVDASLVAPRSIFHDTGTGKLVWKDESGTVNALY